MDYGLLHWGTMHISFLNDYAEGAHPRLLDALRGTNLEQAPGYGQDRFSIEAVELIRTTIGNQQAAIHFVSGGTQANLVALSAMLRPYESAIAVESAHIARHEAGAIEATGHKINVVPGLDGKITPERIRSVCAEHEDEHMVQPRVVVISNTTELGSVYNRQEISAIRSVCDELGLLFYLDGARLGSALASSGADYDLGTLARLVDVFTIGGTKNGALFGEAIVVRSPAAQDHFRWYLKRHGALLAKGRAVGVQFRELFTDGLYLDLARHANAMAERLVNGLRAAGYEFLVAPASNQIFPILPNAVIATMREHFDFYVWMKLPDERSAIRLVTSWATTEEIVESFLTYL